MAITLRDLGAADLIVGRHGWDMVLDKSIPVVGDETGIDYEALLRVRPTHIVLEKGAKGLPPRLEEMATTQGWTIVALPMLSLADVEGAVPALAEVVGTSEAREKAASVAHEMEKAWSRSDAVADTFGRTLILASTDPIGVMGPGSFHYEMLQRMGAHPLPDEGAAWITLSKEDLVRLDPDSIILLIPGEPAKESGVHALGSLSKLPIQAVGGNRVFVVHHPFSQTPSTALIEVAKEIAGAGRAQGGP